MRVYKLLAIACVSFSISKPGTSATNKRWGGFVSRCQYHARVIALKATGKYVDSNYDKFGRLGEFLGLIADKKNLNRLYEKNIPFLPLTQIASRLDETDSRIFNQITVDYLKGLNRTAELEPVHSSTKLSFGNIQAILRYIVDQSDIPSGVKPEDPTEGLCHMRADRLKKIFQRIGVQKNDIRKVFIVYNSPLSSSGWKWHTAVALKLENPTTGKKEWFAFDHGVYSLNSENQKQVTGVPVLEWFHRWAEIGIADFNTTPRNQPPAVSRNRRNRYIEPGYPPTATNLRVNAIFAISDADASFLPAEGMSLAHGHLKAPENFPENSLSQEELDQIKILKQRRSTIFEKIDQQIDYLFPAIRNILGL